MIDLESLNGPPLTPAQLAAYLDRLGLAAEAPSLDYLARLQMRHRQRILFENLNILAGKPTSLERPDLFDKIIAGGRGGVCAELNALFHWLLASLGFAPISYNSRIIAASAPIQFRRHRLIGVPWEGELYLVDVGFNTETARCPLRLVDGLVQSDGLCDYKLVPDDFFGWVLWQKRPALPWRRLLGFDLAPQIDLDFVPGCHYFDTHPASSMLKAPRVSRYTSQGMEAIRDHCLVTEHWDVTVTSRPLTWAEERQVIGEVFGLKASPALDAIQARLGLGSQGETAPAALDR